MRQENQRHQHPPAGKRLSSPPTSVAPVSSSAADGAAASCSAADGTAASARQPMAPLPRDSAADGAAARARPTRSPRRPQHPDWKQMPWRAEDIRRRLDVLLRHNARGAAASDAGTISLETAAELLKTSVGTIEYVVEHAR